MSVKKVDSTSTEVGTTTAVEIEAQTDTAVTTEGTKTALINPTNFVISSDGVYNPSYDGASLPQWLLNAVEQQLTTGDGNIASVINDLAALVTQLNAGVNQNITRIETTEKSISSLTTTVVANQGSNTAAIADLNTAKIDAEGASAIAADVVASSWNTGGVSNAAVGTLMTTYANEELAFASDVDLITAELNGTNASVTRIDEAIVDTADGARAKSSLTVDANGSISGYVAESDGTRSSFTVLADEFKVMGATTGYTPIAVDAVTGKLKFTGDVRFEGLGIDGGSTDIDGGKISTNSLNANTIKANGVISTPIINSGVINGGTINGVQITGSVIKASYIDMSSSAYLTNWKYYTILSDIPTNYYSNFATDATGTPIKDNEGYYRLVTTVPLYSSLIDKTISRSSTGSASIAVSSNDVYPYNYESVFGKKLVTKGFTLPAFSTMNKAIYVIAKPAAYEYGNVTAYGKITILGNTIELTAYAYKAHYSDYTIWTYSTLIKYNGVVQHSGSGEGTLNFNINGLSVSIDYSSTIIWSYAQYSQTPMYPVSTASVIINGSAGTADVDVPNTLNGPLFTIEGNLSVSSVYSGDYGEVSSTIPSMELGLSTIYVE